MALIPVRAGFIPLVDCALLVVAREKGFAATAGIELILSREGAWAAIRDKVAYGLLDCAHMLAAMPLAMHLGLQGVEVAMAVPMALGQGGNAITLAPWLVTAMAEVAPQVMAGPRHAFNHALARVIAQRREAGEPPLKLASVYPFSSHNYELRHWLATAGVDVERDVTLVVVPPPRMVESLARGDICGYCVGEPWNQLAVSLGIGQLVATKQEIWPQSPEKVLGMRAAWMTENPCTVRGLVTALIQAGQWADREDNHGELATLLAREEYVGVAARIILPVLAGQPRVATGASLPMPAYQRFYHHAAQLPAWHQGVWLVEQMVRWGQAEGSTDISKVVKQVFLPHYYQDIVGHFR